MPITSVKLMHKTNTSTWTLRTTQNNPTGSFSLAYDFPAGTHAIKVNATDDAGNSTDSSVVVFQSGNTDRRMIASGILNSGTGSAHTNNFVHINDTNPAPMAQLARAMSAHGESALMNIGSITEFKIWMAWKPWTSNETAATINFASGDIGTHATVGGTGQFVLTNTNLSWATTTDSFFDLRVDLGAMHSSLISNRIYTFGLKWKDREGAWSPNPTAAEQFSFCVDTAAPLIAISTPENGFVYNGSITTATGSVSDTLV